jgi:predicted nicotinamide N-methyase
VTAERAVSADFVRAHTRQGRPSIVPEVALRVADDVVALWEALEGGLEEGLDEGMVDPGSDPPFWAAAWPGGQALARYVLDHPEIVAGRTVLDLGAGSGLVAVAALRAGAAHVIASEVDPYGRAAVAVNAELNGVGPVDVTGDLLDGEPDSGVDVVLAGDVCYDREMTARVLPYLGKAWLGGGGGVPRRPRPALRPAGGAGRGGDVRRPRHRGAAGSADDGVAAALTPPERHASRRNSGLAIVTSR